MFLKTFHLNVILKSLSGLKEVNKASDDVFYPSGLSPIRPKRLDILFKANLLCLLCIGKILWLRYLQSTK